VSRDPGELSSHERAAVARLLEAAVEALRDERLDRTAKVRLGGYLWGTLDTAALYVRSGNRAGLLDKLTASLDRHREELAGGEGR
jgi:hypothetical protein